MTSYTPSRPDLNRVRSTTITSAHVPTMTTMGAATVPPAEPPLSQVCFSLFLCSADPPLRPRIAGLTYKADQ